MTPVPPNVKLWLEISNTLCSLNATGCQLPTSASEPSEDLCARLWRGPGLTRGLCSPPSPASPAAPSQNGVYTGEGRAEGGTFLGLFLRRGRSFSAEVSGGSSDPKGEKVPGVSSSRASRKVATLLGGSVLSRGLSPSALVLFSAQRTFSAFQRVGRGRPHTPNPVFP